jgi:predicted DNA-binding transcriptional regulator AlpA
VISLDELADGAVPASRDEACALMVRLAAAQTRLAASLATLAEAAGGDRLLDIDEAAGRLGQNRQWLYRRSKTLPFVVRLGAQVRFSERGIERFIQSRRGR